MLLKVNNNKNVNTYMNINVIKNNNLHKLLYVYVIIYYFSKVLLSFNFFSNQFIHILRKISFSIKIVYNEVHYISDPYI